MGREHEKSQRPFETMRWFPRGVFVDNEEEGFSLPRCPISFLLFLSIIEPRSLFAFRRARDISESLTAIKTLIKCGTKAGVEEKLAGEPLKRVPWGSVEGERTRERGRTSCGESILLRRRLRRPTFSSSDPLFFFPLAFLESLCESTLLEEVFRASQPPAATRFLQLLEFNHSDAVSSYFSRSEARSLPLETIILPTATFHGNIGSRKEIGANKPRCDEEGSIA